MNSSQTTSAARSVRRVFQTAGICMIYAGLTLVATWPLAIQFGSSFPGWPGDSCQFIWNQWWVTCGLSNGPLNIFECDHIFYPRGVDLVAHTLCPFKALSGAVLSLMVGMIPAFNTVFVLSFVLGGLGAYLLCRELDISLIPAAVAGMLFTFAPLRMGHALGHMNLFSIEWIPFTMYFWSRATRTGSRSDAILTGACLALAGYCGFNPLVQTVIPLAVLTLWRFKPHQWRRCLARLAWAGFAFVVVFFPYLAAFLHLISHNGFNHLQRATSMPSTDLANLLLPNPLHLLWRFQVSRWTLENIGGSHLTCNTLGWTGLILLIAGIVLALRRWRHQVWIAIFVLGWSLSWGLELRVMGHCLARGPVLPYYWMKKIPFLNIAREPCRMSSLMLVAGTVLVGLSLDWIHRRWRIAPLFMGVLIFLELICIPYPLLRYSQSPILDSIRHDPANGAVMAFPIWLQDTTVILDQTIHGRPIPGGCVSRIRQETWDWAMNESVLHHLFEIQDPRIRVVMNGDPVFLIHEITPTPRALRLLQVPNGYILTMPLRSGERFPDMSLHDKLVRFHGAVAIDPELRTITPLAHCVTTITTTDNAPVMAMTEPEVPWENRVGISVPDYQAPPDLTPDHVREWVRKYNFRYILLPIEYRRSRVDRFIHHTLPVEEVGRDDRMIAYRISNQKNGYHTE